MKLIVGLGNPGRKYEKTRHNVGFELLDRLAAGAGRHGDSPGASGSNVKTKFEGQVAELSLEGEAVLLLWPHTFMNLSGRSGRAAVDFYKLPLENLLVVCDDFNLPLGTIRLRARGSHGGQRGLQNIIEQLGTEEFCRLRIGVGPVPESWEAADFVLSRFSRDEREVSDEAITRAVEATRCWLTGGIDETMNQYN